MHRNHLIAAGLLFSEVAPEMPGSLRHALLEHVFPRGTRHLGCSLVELGLMDVYRARLLVLDPRLGALPRPLCAVHVAPLAVELAVTPPATSTQAQALPAETGKSDSWPGPQPLA